MTCMPHRTRLAALAVVFGMTGAASAGSFGVLDSGAGDWKESLNYSGRSDDVGWFARAQNLASTEDQWEIGVGIDPAGSEIDTDDLTWSNAKFYDFELSYANGLASFAIFDGEQLLGSAEYDVGSTGFDVLMLQLRAEPGVVNVAELDELRFVTDDGTTNIDAEFGVGADDEAPTERWAAFGGVGDLADTGPWSLFGRLLFRWDGPAPIDDTVMIQWEALVVPLPAPVMIGAVGLLGVGVLRRRRTLA